jgi:hypothetical protein
MKKTSKASRRSLNEVVLVMPERTLPTGTIEAHSKRTGRDFVTTPLEELKRDWTVINQQVVILLDQTEKTTSSTGFTLDEVTFALGINGKGHIGFIAGVEVGGEASITMTFKRRG